MARYRGNRRKRRVGKPTDKPYELATRDWVQKLEAFILGALEVIIAFTRAMLSCLCIIAGNPIGAIVLVLFILWAIC